MSEVFGRPVQGEVHKQFDQQDAPMNLILALDRVFENPEVEYVSWVQYTPYFNDGDTCEFGIHSWSGGVKFTFSEEEYYEFERWMGYGNASQPITHIDGHDVEVTAEDYTNFAAMLDNGRHFAFLLENFGEHARVIAYRDGFTVESYRDHD